MLSLKVELWVGVSYNLFWKKVGTWSLDQLQFRLPTYVTWSCWCEEWCVHSSVCEFSPPQPQPAGLLLMGVAGHTFILLQSLCTLNWNENQMISSTPLVKSGFAYCQTYSTARAKQVPAMAKKHLHQQAQWMYERDGLDPNASRDASRVLINRWKVNDLFLWLAAAAVFWVKHVKTWWICSALDTSRIIRLAVYLLNGLPLKKRVLNSNYCTAVLKNGSGENVCKTVLIGVFFHCGRQICETLISTIPLTTTQVNSTL